MKVFDLKNTIERILDNNKAKKYNFHKFKK